MEKKKTDAVPGRLTPKQIAPEQKLPSPKRKPHGPSFCHHFFTGIFVGFRGGVPKMMGFPSKMPSPLDLFSPKSFCKRQTVKLRGWKATLSQN